MQQMLVEIQYHYTSKVWNISDVFTKICQKHEQQVYVIAQLLNIDDDDDDDDDRTCSA